MRVIFRGEEKRRRARMEKEASLIHSETLQDMEDEEQVPVDADEVLLEELLRKEEEEVLALLASFDDAQKEDVEMADVDMKDVEKQAP
jgi:hypothetical protein